MSNKTIYDIELPEKAKEEMQDLLNAFKEEAINSLKKSLDTIYTDIGLHVDTDSWINYRSQLQTATENDGEWMKESYFGKKVRASILKEHMDVLVPLLNKDLLEQIKELKEDIIRLENRRIY